MTCRRGVVSILALALYLSACPGAGQAQVQPCDGDGCVEVAVGSPPGAAGVGAVVRVPITFRQGGAGLDDIAAMAFTIDIPGLELADCSDPTSDGLTAAVHVPDAVAQAFVVVIENTTCAGRGSCLCPGPGEQRAEFVNVAIFGPKTLPVPGAGGVDVPILPTGTLLEFDLRVGAGNLALIPLHIFAETDNQAVRPKPQFGALLSIGDAEAVDDTIDNSSLVGNVRTIDGQVTVVSQLPCIGDCDEDGAVTIDEVQASINKFLEVASAGDCAAADRDHDLSVSIDEVQGAINSFLSDESCPRVLPVAGSASVGGGVAAQTLSGDAGDVNGDQRVTAADLVAMIVILATGGGEAGDVNGDGAVDQADIAALIAIIFGAPSAGN